MEVEDALRIHPHAIERLKERWEILMGRKMEESDVFPKLQELILRSEPEPDSLAVQKRKEKYGGGEHRYMISGPWRLVWQGDCLRTVELLKKGYFWKPKLYQGEVRAEFFLRIREGNDFTLLEKAVFNNFTGGFRVLICPGRPEVNAIIRFMRLIGIDVEYRRTGVTIKQASATVLLPKCLRKFELEQTEGRSISLSFPNMKNAFHIFGITKEVCDEILKFVADQEWLNSIPRIKDNFFEMQKIRLAEAAKRKEVYKKHRYVPDKKSGKVRKKKAKFGTHRIRTWHNR